MQDVLPFNSMEDVAYTSQYAWQIGNGFCYLHLHQRDGQRPLWQLLNQHDKAVCEQFNILQKSLQSAEKTHAPLCMESHSVSADWAAPVVIRLKEAT